MDQPVDADPEQLAEEISRGADRDSRRVAVVESLTGGLVSSDPAASSGSSEWFRGGVVAYDRTTKHGVLEVPDGPVVAEPAVRTMAERAAAMFGASLERQAAQGVVDDLGECRVEQVACHRVRRRGWSVMVNPTTARAVVSASPGTGNHLL